jgi:hypothetical protein
MVERLAETLPERLSERFVGRLMERLMVDWHALGLIKGGDTGDSAPASVQELEN